eukprot:TRINITY_DN2403_c0_g1_i1.p1 TRINITY_DN2403_c0_g1~~TRINITY_DN2403_c0_g1_i1.p1  ORF type:complete len:381 (-),score=108.09 TRINITY_DN2403_c0_g1_i1:25-1122(-)
MQNRRLVMIPGPTPVVESIQHQMGRPTDAFKTPEFVSDFKSVIADLKTLWDCENGEAFVLAGSGTLSMEMAVCNTLKSGDRALVISHGYFGDRFVDIMERKGIETDLIQSEWGQIVPVETIAAKLEENDYQAITVTHVDTSTGVSAPIAEIGELLKTKPEVMYIVDGVCATAAEPEYVEQMGIDILLTGSQKAFGVPPGLAIIWASAAAMERRESLGTIPEYYADFLKWLPVMHDPTKYFATPAVNLIWALQESLRIIKSEGIEERYQRHIRNAAYVQERMKQLGFSLLANPEYQAVTLSNLLYPEGIDDAKFRSTLMEEGAVVAGGLGPYAGKLFRLGHMGNIDDHDIAAVIACIERTLEKLAQ